MALTKEDLDQVRGVFTEVLGEAVKTEVGKQVNGAIKKMKPKEDEGGEGLTKESVATMIAEAVKSAQGEPKDKKDGDKPSVDPKVEKELADMRAKLQKISDEKAELDRKQREGEERAELQKALKAAGVRDDALAPALALLYTERRLVTRTEDGTIVFNLKDKTGATEQVDIESGVKGFLKTPEGGFYLPPKKAAAPFSPRTGEGGGGGSGGQKPFTSNQEIAAALESLT